MKKNKKQQALDDAYDVCFKMKFWTENVIAGVCDEDDLTEDKKILKKCNNYIEWYVEHNKK